MEKRYTFSDYENAYYSGQILECKEIGCYLLSRLNSDDQNKTDNFLHKLSNITWEWTDPPEKQMEINKLLADIKIWLMVWDS